MQGLFIVMAGGAIGAGVRYHVGRLALAQLGPGFPWATLIVNLAGGLLMGVLAGALTRDGAADLPLWLFLGTGVLGGFTTFSAFSLDLFAMLGRADWAGALSYVALSVAGALALLALGFWLVRAAA